MSITTESLCLSKGEFFLFVSKIFLIFSVFLTSLSVNSGELFFNSLYLLFDAIFRSQIKKNFTSDLGKIKSYATGEKPTMKQFIESKKRQDKVRFAEEKPAEYAAERGPEVDYDPEPDFASGGIARMLGE